MKSKSNQIVSRLDANADTHSFAIWYLRTSYLNNINDGLAERLVDVNSSVLNTPGYRAAGWSAEPVHRTYSPPIPTTINPEYLRSTAALLRVDSQADEEDEGGMVTGKHSNETVGPSLNIKRRRRKEQIDDDDSSDLSDESDEDEETSQRAAQQIRFAKMPARDRADSSPIRGSGTHARHEIAASDPMKNTVEGRRRGGSMGAVEAVKARARADTTTSSDMSSENEVDPAYFQRRQINTRKPTKARFITDAVEEEAIRDAMHTSKNSTHDDFDADSVDSDLSSDLGDTVESASLLNTLDENELPTSSPIIPGAGSGEVRTLAESPNKIRTLPLDDLPPPRPISYIPPASLLSKALNAQKAAPKNPIQRYAVLSGKGSPNPLWIRIYAPFSADPETPFEMPLARTSKDGSTVIVAEAIGLSLWRYCEEKIDPKFKAGQLDVNRWSLRMVEDGEVDFDFPALQRTKPVTDFTSNNNRGARARSRERPFDEFALVEASEREYQVNLRETPMFSPPREELTADTSSHASAMTAVAQTSQALRSQSRLNLLVAGQPFGSALTDRSVTPADRPAQPTSQSTPRIGAMKTVRIRYFDLNVSAQSMTMEVSADSYIAEILDHVCRRWNFDKAAFNLKVAGTNTVAPLDRTVEALGTRSDLELVRKRFGAGPTSLTGSPGSGSPSAPLLLDVQWPKRGKKGHTAVHPLAQKQDLLTGASNFKKYYVTRKQLTSFSQNNQRVLIFDGDFLHNMPSDAGKTLDSHAKTNSFAFGDILKCKVSTKHSKLIRVVVRRSAESKRYDFEARTAGEAQEIVDEVTKEMSLARGG